MWKKERQKQVWIAVGLIAALGLIVPLYAAAQFLPPSIADQQEQRDRAERQAREREWRQALPEVRGDDSTRRALLVSDSLPDESPCVVIESITLQGEHREAFSFAQRYLNRYAGRCIGQQGVGLIVRRTSDLILAEGYVTSRIGVSEQDFTAGVLALELTAGTIGQIRFEQEDASTYPDRTWRSAFPSRPGDVLNLHRLEQGLEQLRRVPSQQASMTIAPAQTPEQSDVIIRIQRQRPWRGALSLDDSGNEATGKPQVNLTIGLDNLAGINDLLNINLSTDGSADRNKGMRGYHAAYSIPWGNWRFGAVAHGYRYRQPIQGAMQTFDFNGRSRTAELTMERLVSRGPRHRTSAELRVMQRHARSDIEGVELIQQRRRTTAIEGAVVHRRHFGRAQMDARLAHRRGVPWLGGDDDEAGRYPDSPIFRYATTTLDVAWMQPFSIDERAVLWNSALRYQWTDDPLYGSEYLAIGGRYTVNGFDGEMTLSGEQGGYWRNSLTLPLHPSFIMPYAGIDLGHISRVPERGISGGTLAGGYLGLRGSAADTLTWDAFVGWRLDAPREFKQHAHVRTYGFRVAYLF